MHVVYIVVAGITIAVILYCTFTTGKMLCR